MVEFLIYDLKVAALVAVFYMFYRLLLSRDTLHRMNRVVLLTTAVASFVLPLCVITIHHTVVIEEAPLSSPVGDTIAAAAPITAAAPSGAVWGAWGTVFTVVFFVGVAVTLGHLLCSVAQVIRLVRRSERHAQADGTVVCVTDKEVSPFSFYRYIVLNRQDFESPDPAIMAHERGHIRLHHTLDVLLVDTLTVLQWFNPAMWMLRQDLRAIHEYEADAAVLSQGINMRQYQYLLIQKAVSACGYSVANGISHSTLKNRITMMLTNKKTSRMSWLKMLAMLPIVGTTLALNAETVNDYVFDNTQQEPQKKVVKKGKKAGQVKMGAKTIEVKAEQKAETTAAEKTVAKPAEIKQAGLKPVSVGTGEAPLIVINGKVSTEEQMKALDAKDIDNVNVVKNEEMKAHYAKYFNADTSNGIIFINTKEYAKNGKKELAAVTVKAKEPQEEKSAEPGSEGVFDIVEHMPTFPGGQMELMKFLAENVRYPKEAEEKGKQGRVVLTFIVEKDGSVSNIDVAKKVCDELDAEAVRVVSSMPKWTPGMQNGKNVRVKYTVPVTFRLQ